MASSIDFDLCEAFRGCQTSVKARRHSWPEADLCFLRPCTSGIFEPLADQEEVELRSTMTSRNSNYSTGSCNLF